MRRPRHYRKKMWSFWSAQPFGCSCHLGRTTTTVYLILPLAAIFHFSNDLIRHAKASLLAQSKLEMCDKTSASETLDCDEKVTLLLSIEQAQLQGTEALEITVSNDEKQLKTPLKITWSKTKSYWKYPLRYLEQIPSRMVEHYGTSASCTDDVGGQGATCGICTDSRGNYMKYSEGFCCMCTPGGFIENTRNRGGVDCGDLIDSLSRSYHCIKPDSLWYAGFEVETPIMMYNINIQVQHQDLSFQNLTISHLNPISSNNYVVAELTGDLATARPPNNFQQQYLVVPDRFFDGGGKLTPHPRVLLYPHHLRYAMLLDKSFFDLSGETCDRIGVAWAAFKYQSEMCERPVGSCVKNQIENFHQEDTQRVGENYDPQDESGQKPLYFVSRYCDGLMEGTQVVDDAGYIVDEYFVCPLDEQRQTTMVRLELKADSLKFVSSIGKAKIYSVEVKNFEAFSGAGTLEAKITSESDFRAQFSLGIMCSTGITPAPVPALFLERFEEKRVVEIQVMANSKEELAAECTLNLLDLKGRLLDSRSASFTVLQTREKSSLGQQRGQTNAQQMDPKEYGDGECSAVCGFFAFTCHLKYFGACWWNFFLALGVIALFLVAGWWLVTGRCNPVLEKLCPARAKRKQQRKEEEDEQREVVKKKLTGTSGFQMQSSNTNHPSNTRPGDMQDFFLKMQALQEQNTLLQLQISQQIRKSVTSNTSGLGGGGLAPQQINQIVQQPGQQQQQNSALNTSNPTLLQLQPIQEQDEILIAKQTNFLGGNGAGLVGRSGIMPLQQPAGVQQRPTQMQGQLQGGYNTDHPATLINPQPSSVQQQHQPQPAHLPQIGSAPQQQVVMNTPQQTTPQLSFGQKQQQHLLSPPNNIRQQQQQFSSPGAVINTGNNLQIPVLTAQYNDGQRSDGGDSRATRQSYYESPIISGPGYFGEQTTISAPSAAQVQNAVPPRQNVQMNQRNFSSTGTYNAKGGKMNYEPTSPSIEQLAQQQHPLQQAALQQHSASAQDSPSMQQSPSIQLVSSTAQNEFSPSVQPSPSLQVRPVDLINPGARSPRPMAQSSPSPSLSVVSPSAVAVPPSPARPRPMSVAAGNSKQGKQGGGQILGNKNLPQKLPLGVKAGGKTIKGSLGSGAKPGTGSSAAPASGVSPLSAAGKNNPAFLPAARAPSMINAEGKSGKDFYGGAARKGAAMNGKSEQEFMLAKARMQMSVKGGGGKG
ncbi:unnamed protein product [Amoebophrya sp. A120]|nr:unnamed protein product [Amoebophrya sp. A120]|eukprot:GSA120T00024727001.1